MQTQTSSDGSNPIKELYDRALKKLKAGHTREAEMICRRALPVYRKDPNIMCLLGEISLMLRRSQEAQTWYGKVLKNFNDYPRALEGMGLALLADSRPKEAVDFLKKAVDAAPRRAKTRTIRRHCGCLPTWRWTPIVSKRPAGCCGAPLN